METFGSQWRVFFIVGLEPEIYNVCTAGLAHRTTKEVIWASASSNNLLHE
jgi:hypothetical protein